MPTITKVYEIVIRGHYVASGTTVKNISNVFHYLFSGGGGSPGNASDLLTAFLAGPWAAIAALLPTSYIGDESLCRTLDDALAQYINGAAPASGGRAVTRLPGDVAIAYLFRTPSRGRNFKGSKHLGPVPAPDVTGDEINGGAIANWQGIGTQMSNVIIGASTAQYQPCVVSKTLSQLVANPTTIIGDIITQVLTNKTIGTMRRRKEKTVR